MKRIIGVLTALLSGLLVAAAFAPPASAAVRTWSTPVAYPYPGNWHCTERNTSTYSVDVCLINSHNGVEPVYKAVMIVWNHRSTGFQMSGAVINMWAQPSPSTQVRDDACYDSGLSGGYRAACYGTAITLSALCDKKRDATTATANGAVNIPAVASSRIAVESPRVTVNC
ncbi:hypothetical protein B0I31_10269 [Saccharothrix carnea]|uniref:Secreted protein n=1 Tax=Saccharothrix carnea TaxID=1280637 RepID=A0A2P8IF59_SACCR|nr:hypothetical protein [Saccharothrix carnea]PSL57092.1 hypothetical protein B0I31_10269 [Saccharothrix carnea]